MPTPRWAATNLTPSPGCCQWLNRRERLLAVMELGPRTFCHLDLHPGNLFATDGQIVLIDWTLVASEPLAKMPAT